MARTDINEDVCNQIALHPWYIQKQCRSALRRKILHKLVIYLDDWVLVQWQILPSKRFALHDYHLLPISKVFSLLVTIMFFYVLLYKPLHMPPCLLYQTCCILFEYAQTSPLWNPTIWLLAILPFLPSQFIPLSYWPYQKLYVWTSHYLFLEHYLCLSFVALHNNPY